MSSEMQEGIYYRSKPPMGNSLCFISLRSDDSSKIMETGKIIVQIWNRLRDLKEGILADLKIDPKHRKRGGLSVLIGYGPRIFEIKDSKKTRPLNFNTEWNFKQPNPQGGGVIVDGSNIKYSSNINENHLLYDHIIFQLIAENEFYTSRAAVEIWKELRRWNKHSKSTPLRITGMYAGFQRADRRNWQGFHDGISNLKRQERPYVISIDSRNLSSMDKWIAGGSYLAFMRISIDLESWEDLNIREQEKLIGRDKLTGCPLIKIDKYGNPVKDSRCPVRGTTEVIESGNEYFRDYPAHLTRFEDKLLQYSHIRKSRPSDRVPFWDRKSSRIYRQGFEFLSASSNNQTFIMGLNFISFQNSPERLMRALTYRNKISSVDPHPNVINTVERYFSVSAAGVFFVPPVVRGEIFPGAKIFFGERDLRILASELSRKIS